MNDKWQDNRRDYGDGWTATSEMFDRCFVLSRHGFEACRLDGTRADCDALHACIAAFGKHKSEEEGRSSDHFMTLPTEYWTLDSCGRVSHPESHARPVGPWALCYRTPAAALDAARAVLAAAEGSVLELSGQSRPPYGPDTDDRNGFGPHRVEWRPIPGTRELRGPDGLYRISVWLEELYELRVVRDRMDVEIRTIDGKDFECRTPRVEALVDWTTDLRPHVGRDALWSKGPWRAELYTTAHRHVLPWAEEGKEHTP